MTAERIIASQDQVLKSGFASSAPSRMVPNLLRPM
jgi:hypothetical protein